MMNNRKTELKVRNKVIALLIGILMNPIMLAIIFVADFPHTSNKLTGSPLLERMPFAYSYFWTALFLPGNPPEFSSAILLAIISNTILYSVLSYVVLNHFWKERIKLR